MTLRDYVLIFAVVAVAQVVLVGLAYKAGEFVGTMDTIRELGVKAK